MGEKDRASLRISELRALDVAALEEISQGSTCTVFALSPTTILKAYPHEMPVQNVVWEFERACGAHSLGIPCARAFELVRLVDQKCSDNNSVGPSTKLSPFVRAHGLGGNEASGAWGLGIIFERLEGPSVGDVIMSDQKRSLELAHKMGELLRFIHQRKPDKLGISSSSFATDSSAQEAHAYKVDIADALPDQRKAFMSYCERFVDPDISMFSHEEAAAIRHMYELLDERRSFIHGDFHPANILLVDDKLTLIDLEGAGLGHPLLDWAGVWQALWLIPTLGPELSRAFVGLEAEAALALFEPLFSAYFGDVGPKERERKVEAMRLYGLAKFACMMVRSPFSAQKQQEVADLMRGQLLWRVDNVEELLREFD